MALLSLCREHSLHMSAPSCEHPNAE